MNGFICFLYNKINLFKSKRFKDGRCTYSINVQPVLPTLLQNELNSDIARFTNRVRTCLKTKKDLRIFFLEMGKRATSLFNLFCSNFAN